MLPLITLPNPILRKISEKINLPPNDELREFAKQMFAAMKHYDGIGLAAPQVNRSIQMMVINTPTEPTAFINPTILKKSWKKINMEEGCLSVPGIFGIVRRPEKIYVNYTALDGKTHTEWLTGIKARVYQHEVDHLNGILFIDHVKKITQGKELLGKYVVK